MKKISNEQELELKERELQNKKEAKQSIKKAILFFGSFSLGWPIFVMTIILFAEFFTYNAFHATLAKVMSYMAVLYIFSISAGILAVLCVAVCFYVLNKIEVLQYKRRKEKENKGKEI